MRNFSEHTRIIAVVVIILSMVIAPAVSSSVISSPVANISCICCCSHDLETVAESNSCEMEKSRENNKTNLTKKDSCCCSFSDQSQSALPLPLESNLPIESKSDESVKTLLSTNIDYNKIDIGDNKFSHNDDVDIGLSSSPPLFLINSSFLI